nr:RNA-directed DNA polymerase, eukaryota, nucleotide-binding alpha-beta plait domain protein [Tanacetum cinerariifolium]
MGAHNKNSLQSKADQTVRISKSVFVSNFPEGCTTKYLWKVCNNYGTVVDVFIPNKKSNVGKRFAFVKFVKVINLDHLIENLNIIWIGRFHLFANLVRFKRPKKPNLLPHNNAAAASSYLRGVDQAKGQFQAGSYVNLVNVSSLVGVHGPSISSASVLVLDDSCVVERDLSNHVMGNVKDVSSISNLQTLIMEERFSVVNLVYLGGLWVMIECDNVETKANMLKHTRVKSWFHVLQNVVYDFVSGERIVWVDIKGISLNVWSRETFTRIGKKWGEALDIEDNVDSSFGRKRLCIKTKLPLSILESFKDIFKGSFRNHIDELEKKKSVDPFNIYRLLRKQSGDESHEVSSSLSHPPGFTPDVSIIQNENGQSAKEIPVMVNDKVMNNSQDVYKEASYDNVDLNVVKKGGSILGVMEDMIRVGKVMGYSIDGLGHKTKKEWIKEFTSKNKINFMAIQERNSGGILCVWEATVFKKDYATISDNFVSRKQLLWDYVSTLIGRWNGEVVVLGDFNE